MNIKKALSLREGVKFSVYTEEDINPVSGTKKRRRIYNPNQVVRRVHEDLKAFLKPFTRRLTHSVGFVGGVSFPTRQNVLRHQGHRFFYLTDLHSAYQFVDGAKLAGLLTTLDRYRHSEELWREFIEVFCLTHGGGLITGAPASPALFNVYAGFFIDRPLGAIAEWNDLTYSRYLDDLTFSSMNFELAERDSELRRGIRETITMAGFQIHHRKSVVADLVLGPIFINGIGLELDGRIFLPRHYLRKLRGMIHLAMYKEPELRPKVHGMMGVFWTATDKRRMNKTERKLKEAYRRLLQVQNMGV